VVLITKDSKDLAPSFDLPASFHGEMRVAGQKVWETAPLHSSHQSLPIDVVDLYIFLEYVYEKVSISLTRVTFLDGVAGPGRGGGAPKP
jgi:hypothetical protein